MQVPPFFQGESLARLLQGAAFGAVAATVVGFYWGGWVLGSTADKLAMQKSENAVIAAMAPVCADKFRALTDYDARKVALEKADSWNRKKEFPEELVTLPGGSYVNSDLVDSCSKLVLAPASAAVKAKDTSVQ